jgi:hypothetical protein
MTHLPQMLGVIQPTQTVQSQINEMDIADEYSLGGVVGRRGN